MNPAPTIPDTASLMRTLESKVGLLLTQSLAYTLEISQLKQENARLIAQLRGQPSPDATRLDT
jgi:hypothetical protein